MIRLRTRFVSRSPFTNRTSTCRAMSTMVRICAGWIYVDATTGRPRRMPTAMIRRSGPCQARHPAAKGGFWACGSFVDNFLPSSGLRPKNRCPRLGREAEPAGARVLTLLFSCIYIDPCSRAMFRLCPGWLAADACFGGNQPGLCQLFAGKSCMRPDDRYDKPHS